MAELEKVEADDFVEEFDKMGFLPEESEFLMLGRLDFLSFWTGCLVSLAKSEEEGWAVGDSAKVWPIGRAILLAKKPKIRENAKTERFFTNRSEENRRFVS